MFQSFSKPTSQLYLWGVSECVSNNSAWNPNGSNWDICNQGTNLLSEGTGLPISKSLSSLCFPMLLGHPSESLGQWRSMWSTDMESHHWESSVARFVENSFISHSLGCLGQYGITTPAPCVVTRIRTCQQHIKDLLLPLANKWKLFSLLSL